MLTSILILLMLAIQLGPSYYASVASVALILVIINWFSPIAAGAIRSARFSWIVVLMPLQLLDLPSYDPSADLLRVAREAVLFVLLCGAVLGARYAATEKLRPTPVAAIVGIIGFLFLLAVVQSIMLPRGVYIGVPEAYYTLETGTIATEAALRWTADALRPTGTFSEPSYLGFVLISLSLMLAPRLDTFRSTLPLLIVIILTGLLARSLAFVFALGLVILLPIAFQRGRNRGLIVVGALLGVAAALVFTPAVSIIGRLFLAASSTTADYSTNVRIVAPFQTLPGYLLAHPFGAPFSVVDRVLMGFIPDTSIDVQEFRSNAFTYLFFIYGIVAAPLIGLTVRCARDLRSGLYLLICFFFNGTYFAIDKVAIIAMTIFIYEYGMRARALALPAPGSVPLRPAGQRATVRPTRPVRPARLPAAARSRP